jgi:hypothetical protein
MEILAQMTVVQLWNLAEQHGNARKAQEHWAEASLQNDAVS